MKRKKETRKVIHLPTPTSLLTMARHGVITCDKRKLQHWSLFACAEPYNFASYSWTFRSSLQSASTRLARSVSGRLASSSEMTDGRLSGVVSMIYDEIAKGRSIDYGHLMARNRIIRIARFEHAFAEFWKIINIFKSYRYLLKF